MGRQTVGNKDIKKLIRVAESNGARIIYGKTHAKIYDGPVLVAVVSYGHTKDRVPGGNQGQVIRAFRKRGWNA